MLQRLVECHCTRMSFRGFLPVDHAHAHATSVTVERNVPQPKKKMLLFEDDGARELLVVHSPLAVHCVVVAAQLRLSPQRRTQLTRTPTPNNHPKHVVLDRRAHHKK